MADITNVIYIDAVFSPDVQSSPFATGDQFRVTDASPITQTLLDDTLGSYVTAWNDGAACPAFRVSNTLGTTDAAFKARVLFSGVQYESNLGGNFASHTGLANLSGVSVRIKKICTRFAGTRNGSKFFPFPPASFYDPETGLLNSTASDGYVTAMTDLYEAMTAVNMTPVVCHHTKAGASGVTDVSAVVTVPQVSFLNRRYK